MGKLARAASIDDLRLLAKRRLPRSIFEFVDGGAGAEETLRRNRSDLQRLTLLPYVSVNVAQRSTEVLIAGQGAALPLILAPTGLAGLYWPEGEIAAARAAAAAGIPFCLSTNSVASMEEVAKACPDGDRWFQLYFLKDEALMDALLNRARSNGYRVLCLTLDLAVQGRRDRDIRNAFTVPFRPTVQTIYEILARPRWLAGFLRGGRMRFGNFEGSLKEKGFQSIAGHIAKLCDSGADWDTVARVISKWDGPVVIKGILNPDDAKRALSLGPEAIIVSNHGGRQLDGVPSAIVALPEIVKAVAGRTQVILDGGVNRGTDLLKARALGASACMIGRGFLWGLAAGGQAGVARAIDIYRGELDTGIALLGRPSFEYIDRGSLMIATDS
jgi:isopentenyl diphosphate isomerase/L-lactate dehydrogenase-like FMN-dependent dehydrogenase